MPEQETGTEFADYPYQVAGSLVHERAARYAKQMINHWGRHAERLDTLESTTTMYFSSKDFGGVSAVRMDVQADRIVMGVGAMSAETATMLADSITEHMHHFAGKRDTLTVQWDQRA